MIPLYSNTEYTTAKSVDLLTLECEYCFKPFTRMKKDVKRSVLGTRPDIRCCSISCSKTLTSPPQLVNCLNCGTHFLKDANQIKRSPNHFCSRSCSGTYNNKNKTHGTRRSKLEVWLEEQLPTIYPNLPMDFNQKDTIGSELDIYIPSLNLAFEINGIFHYEPIYGKNKLGQIQENDISKSKACHDARIDLCVIDTSQQKYVKPKTSQKYLDIITNIIDERLLTS